MILIIAMSTHEVFCNRLHWEHIIQNSIIYTRCHLFRHPGTFLKLTVFPDWYFVSSSIRIHGKSLIWTLDLFLIPNLWILCFHHCKFLLVFSYNLEDVIYDYSEKNTSLSLPQIQTLRSLVMSTKSD
jgi:hypothetical protein